MTESELDTVRYRRDEKWRKTFSWAIRSSFSLDRGWSPFQHERMGRKTERAGIGSERDRENKKRE